MRNILGNPNPSVKSFCWDNKCVQREWEGVTADFLSTRQVKRNMEQSVFTVWKTRTWRRTGKLSRIVFSPVPAAMCVHPVLPRSRPGRKPWRVPHPRSCPGSPTRTWNGLPGMCVPLNFTSMPVDAVLSRDETNRILCLENRVNYPESQTNMSRTIDTNDKMLIRDSVHMRRLFI